MTGDARMTVEQRQSRGFRVRAMLEDGELGAAFDDVKADLIAEWERCFDAGEREALWRAVNTLNLVRGRLASFAGGAARGDGAMAAVRRG